MASRIELQTMLENILGSRNVYYQPPPSIKIKYPAIIYSKSNIKNIFANDGVYIQDHAYQLVLIDDNPDNTTVDKISRLPKCNFDRHFKSENLNHYNFTIYY